MNNLQESAHPPDRQTACRDSRLARSGHTHKAVTRLVFSGCLPGDGRRKTRLTRAPCGVYRAALFIDLGRQLYVTFA
ncbi:hypothetical protein ElyMa_006878500 [Elysia marginata]|uniref:Uncharacterized protein n=1 Tax=Elysia marginata TaxID=1093978 RepID=A0AAV4JE43_9GAST|nr:hypothetical protein ElyMa_006878500 [Elysia marginata]